MFLVLLIGAPEHAAKHFVKHREGGVREARFHLTRKNDQRRQAARRIEPRDITRNKESDFTGDCGIAGTMNALFAIRFDLEFADGLQPFDKGQGRDTCKNWS